MIKVNLLKGHRVEAGKPAIRAPQVNRAGIYLLCLFVAVTAGLAWAWWSLDTTRAAKLQALEEQRTEIARLEKLRAAAAQYQQQKQALLNRISVIEQLRKSQTGPVELLNQLIACIPEQPDLWLEVLTQKGDLVHLEGYAITIETISDFMSALGRTGHFQNVELEYFTGEQRAVKFSLNCTVRQPKKDPAA